MRRLRDDKKVICSGTEDKIILCRNGYFNLINGYKKPFVCNIDASGKHIYYPGTSIKQIELVKRFDEDLRIVLLKYITKAEEEVRTFAGYKFDELTSGTKAWYEVQSYDNLANPVKDIVSMISKSYAEISKSELDYVKFYLENHNSIPTWIYVKVINFSTFIDFLSCCKNDLKDSLCNLYGMLDAKGNYDYKLLIGSLHWLRKVRNSCAHNERIFMMERKNARIKEKYILNDLRKVYSRTPDQKIFDLLIYLKYYLDDNDYLDLITNIKEALNKLSVSLSSNVFNNIRASLGVKNISDLDDLLKNKAEKQYNKF